MIFLSNRTVTNQRDNRMRWHVKPTMTDRKSRKDRTDRPAWPGPACRFLDFALRASLEMTKDVLRSK